MMGSCAGQAKKSNHRGDKVFGALLFYGMLWRIDFSCIGNSVNQRATSKQIAFKGIMFRSSSTFGMEMIIWRS
jgi:hypothetical protein